MTGSTERLPFLDTNIPMYAAGREHPYREICQWVMRQIAEGQLVVATDTEVFQEILHRYGLLGRYEEAAMLVTDLMMLVERVYPVTVADVQRAVDLFRRYAPQGVRSRDLIHVAVMLNNGLTDIISTDRHFDLVEGIRRIDPLNLHQKAMKLLDEGSSKSGL